MSKHDVALQKLYYMGRHNRREEEYESVAVDQYLSQKEKGTSLITKE